MLQIGGIKGRNPEIERRPKLFDERKACRRARTVFVQYGRSTDPKRKAEIVAKPIGKKQFGLGVEDITLAYTQRLDAKSLAGDDHIAMTVNGCLWRSCGTRRIEPEAVVISRCRCGFKVRVAIDQQTGERTRGTFSAKYHPRHARGARDG